MNTGDVTEAMRIATQVEEFLTTVEMERYGRVTDSIYKSFLIRRYVDEYVAGATYPISRIVESTLRLIDVRLQVEYTFTLNGVENSLYYSYINDRPELTNSPRLELLRMTLNQSLIGSVRIGWEKLFRFIHHLETGRTEIAGKSVKKAFFRWVRTQPKWRFMEPYEEVIETFDAKYRTAEFHKHSILRGRILKNQEIDVNELLTPSNYLGNVIWPNTIEILHGRPPNTFTDLHASGELMVDPRYLELRHKDGDNNMEV